MLSTGLENFGIEERCRRRNGDLRIADEPRAPMRDNGFGKKFQIGILRQREGLMGGVGGFFSSAF